MGSFMHKYIIIDNDDCNHARDTLILIAREPNHIHCTKFSDVLNPQIEIKKKIKNF